MQQALERGLNPLLSLLPLCLFGSAIVFDLGAMATGLPAFRAMAFAIQAVALVVGLITLTVLLVDYTTAPVGSVAHQVRGLASATTTVMVAGFALAWFLRGEGVGAGPVFLLELLAYGGGLAGALVARSPQSVGFDPVEADRWPFTAAQ